MAPKHYRQAIQYEEQQADSYGAGQSRAMPRSPSPRRAPPRRAPLRPRRPPGLRDRRPRAAPDAEQARQLIAQLEQEHQMTMKPINIDATSHTSHVFAG